MSWGNLRWARLARWFRAGASILQNLPNSGRQVQGNSPQIWLDGGNQIGGGQDQARGPDAGGERRAESACFAFRMPFEALEEGDPAGDRSVPPGSVRCGPAR